MSKATNWFKHDFNARNDEKLLLLSLEFGFAVKGLFWDIVEKMYESGDGSFSVSDLKLMAILNKTDYEITEKMFFEFVNHNLFFEFESKFYSQNVINQIEAKTKHKMEVSEKRKLSGSLGGLAKHSKTEQNVANVSKSSKTEQNTVDKIRLDKKRLEENKKELKEKYSKEFEIFHRCYDLYSNRDRLRSVETEFRLFVNKHKDFKEVLVYLETAIQRQNQHYKQKGTETQYQRKFANWLADREFEAFKNKQQTEAERWAEHEKRALAYEATK